MSDSIESRLKEERRFQPSGEFSKLARVQSHAEYTSLYRTSIDEPETFWREQTTDLVFRTPWKKFAEWDLPHAKFFVGATLNLTESCLDRHLSTEARTRAAIVWEGEPGDQRNASGRVGSPTVVQNTSLAATGSAANSSASMTSGARPAASTMAVCSSRRCPKPTWCRADAR